ncbi:MAG: plasmid pRiA4b ORF-3 family protein [Myxococcota bacterium]|nr:plasmid pRiA4b ORF-3 family protein [Myxococcota bacterium]
MQTSELEIRLDGSDVSRRVIIGGDALLGDLHALVQTSMGWNDTAFHSFETGGATYGDLDDEDFVDGHPDAQHEDDVSVGEAFQNSKQLKYRYGSWTHTIGLIGTSDRDSERPACLDGRGACPGDPEGEPEVAWNREQANARIAETFVDIPEYDADAPQEPAIWRGVELDAMLPPVFDYLERRAEDDPGDARILRAHLQVLAEAMIADGDAPELTHAVGRFTKGGMRRAEAVDAMVALMCDYPEVLDHDAEGAFDDYLAAVDAYDVATFKQRFPGSAAGAVAALAAKIASRDPGKKAKRN